MTAWWQDFFDDDYVRLWQGLEAPDKADREAAGLWAVLALAPGSTVLDAPCGYGRLSHLLARKGATVLGVDASRDVIAEAERRRGDLPTDRLRFRCHDLREPLPESGFDAALNVFSSLGYGTEADDLAVLATLRAAVRAGGLVFIETTHRDRVVAELSQNSPRVNRLPDGSAVTEEPRLDAVTGRVETTWSWTGPRGSGRKSASIRAYTATELVRLVAEAGLRVRSLHDGCSTAAFTASGAVARGRLGILAVRD